MGGLTCLIGHCGFIVLSALQALSPVSLIPILICSSKSRLAMRNSVQSLPYGSMCAAMKLVMSHTHNLMQMACNPGALPQYILRAEPLGRVPALWQHLLVRKHLMASCCLLVRIDFGMTCFCLPSLFSWMCAPVGGLGGFIKSWTCHHLSFEPHLPGHHMFHDLCCIFIPAVHLGPAAIVGHQFRAQPLWQKVATLAQTSPILVCSYDVQLKQTEGGWVLQSLCKLSTSSQPIHSWQVKQLRRAALRVQWTAVMLERLVEPKQS